MATTPTPTPTASSSSSSSPFLLTTPLHPRPRIRIPTHPFLLRFPTPFQIRVLGFSRKRARSRLDSVCSVSRGKEGGDVTVVEEAVERPRFDINLAVILAGFAFEAYYTPPDNIGRHEMDGAGCKTAYLSKSFVREIYDGQLFVNLKKGFDFPALDLWGTSDPYVVMQLGGQVCKSKVKWATIAPTWNEEFTFNTKQRPEESLQVAAWDANLVTPHKRLGNSAVKLVDLCDGNLHELLVELEGMGGGGKIQLEVKYKSFDEIDKEKEWWRVVPFVSEFLRRSGFESALQKLVGSETVQASQFVQYAFSQFKSLNDMYLQKELSPANSNNYLADKGGSGESDMKPSSWPQNDHPEGFSGTVRNERGDNIKLLEPDSSSDGAEVGKTTQSNMHFWKNFADVISQSVVQKLGMPVPEKMKWDGFELLNKSGLQMGRVAEAGYIESGLATPSTQEADDKKEPESSPLGMEKIYSSLPDIKRAAEDLLTQTDSLFGGLMVMAAAVPQLRKEANDVEATEIQEGGSSKPDDVMLDLVKSNQIEDLDEKKAEEMKTLFSTAESAMEAWAMLASSLGHPSFIKSEFEKLCFLDNSSTDTQVAIWRDSRRKRLVVAFRGTEQVRWKDLRTDLMLAPAGLNPERLGGNFKEEVQVHSGFLTAYDSVRTKIMSLIQQAVACRGDGAGTLPKWNVYVTGHSLGGALATLLALELSSSHLAKSGAISVAMYNFGSPRVGNRRFAEVYNEKVKDSWRVVNQRDIIPTVPRLMGYCHVAQPVYLTARVLRRTYENLGPLIDGYNGDVIGESTPDRLVSEFMRGEKEFIEKILQTEINIFRSIRDGTGLMQHMEDFYYISLLEKVSNYQIDSAPQNEGDGLPLG